MRHGTMDQYGIANGISALVLILQLVLLVCTLGASSASTDGEYLIHSYHKFASPTFHMISACYIYDGNRCDIPDISTNLHGVHPSRFVVYSNRFRRQRVSLFPAPRV